MQWLAKILIKLMSAIEFLSFIYPDIVESQLLITSILKKGTTNLKQGNKQKQLWDNTQINIRTKVNFKRAMMLLNNTPGPWLVRFFRSGKNPQDLNLQHLKVISNQKRMRDGIPSFM